MTIGFQYPAKRQCRFYCRGCTATRRYKVCRGGKCKGFQRRDTFG